MPKLTVQQKERIIHLAVNHYNETYDFLKRSKASRQLQDVLNSSQSVAYKWARIKEYLGNVENNNKKLKRFLSEAIAAAKNPAVELTPIAIANWNEETLNYCTESTKASFIQRLLDVTDWNYNSVELKDRLRNDQLSLAEKWRYLLDYLRNRVNHSFPLYRKLSEYLWYHNINVDHWGHALDCVRQARNSDLNDPSRKQTYERAKTYITRITSLLTDQIATLAECEFYSDDYINCIKHYNEAIYKPSEYTPEQLRLFKNQRNLALVGLLKANAFNRQMQAKERANARDHQKGNLADATLMGTALGAAPGVGLMYLGVLGGEAIFPLVLIPAGLVVAAAGATTGAVSGAAYGFFKTQTRNPINIPEQDALIEKLERFSNESNEVKTRMMSSAIEEYERTRTIAASKASSELLTFLKSAENSIESRWAALAYYMLESASEHLKHEDVYFKNNGKKLFCIVDEQIRLHCKNSLETSKELIEAPSQTLSRKS